MSSVLTRRFLAALSALALVAGFAPLGAPAIAATGDPVLINEVLVSTTGTDVEFAELYGVPGTSLAGLSLIVVESDPGTTYGAIDRRLDFGAGAMLGGNGYHLVGNGLVTTAYGVTPDTGIFNDYFENSSLTIALVTTASITGTSITGSEVVRDSIAVIDGDGVPALGAPVFGPDGTFLPAGAHRVVTGVDTDTTADWALGDFSLTDSNNPNTPTSGTPFGGVGEVVADCGDPVRVLEGAAGGATVTAADSDGTVTAFAITGVTPSDPGTFSIGSVTPSPSVGAAASAQVGVAATTPDGTYEVTIQASNDDATPQTDTCVLTVTVDPILTIGEVQGDTTDAESGTADRSPMVGETVAVRGVVTQRLRLPTAAGGQNYAFFLQSTIAGADSSSLSSDGIYVFMGRFTTLLREGSGSYFPTVGDQLVLRGPVEEFFNLTQLNNPRVVAVERSGTTAVDLAKEVLTTEAEPADELDDANRYWERHESMLFHLDAGAKVVMPRDVFPGTFDAEAWVIRGDHPLAERDDPYARRVFRDVHPLDDIGPAGSFDNGNGMRILLASHGLKWNAGSNTELLSPARTFDTVTNALTGGLTYTFGKYGIEVQQQLALAAGADPYLNAPPSAAVAGAEYATSDYNVENLYDFRDDPNDGCDFADDEGCEGVDPPFDYVPPSEADYQHHLADLAGQIAGPMHAPDILFIQEAEDQDICRVDGSTLACGTADDADGQPDTLQDLALAVSALGGPTYAAAFDRDGADDRGIISAFLYRTDTVELLPVTAGDPVLSATTGIDYPGAPLPYNSEVSNPKAVNAELPAGVPGPIDNCDEPVTCVFTRDPQVGHFRVWRDGVGTSTFTDLWALSNHFSSGPDNRVGQRTQQATYNAAILEAILEADPDARFVTAGDFNVFPPPDDPFAPGDSRYPSDQLAALYEAGLRNLYDTLLAEVPSSAYSYVFQGMTQTLDMQFANDRLFDELVQVRAAHLNADFAAEFTGDVARGASDHDPQIARWSKAVTVERLGDLVGYFVASGDVDPAKAGLLYRRLERAAAFLAAGNMDAYLSQLEAFGDQAQDLSPRWIADEAADVLEREADTVTAP
ncbi:MAG TPA: endonuclease [Candidatus Limnocylindria bacterium]|nr:endonuclease [Candidatus Limnocylindria bacterium]